MTRILILCLALLAAGPLTADDETDPEIAHLLEFVAGSGCTFHRNGAAHDPEDAADHLRLKLRRGGRYVDNADQFIDRLATKSSWSGKPYTVECSEGAFQPSGAWLHGELDAYRASAAD